MQHSHSELELVILGVGAGATSVYHGDASSAFLLRVSGSPRLLLDAGYGTVQAALAAGGIPDDVFISHNHSDHAGELPVLLAVERQRGRRLRLLAETGVLQALEAHRLAELRSTGRPLADFAESQACDVGVVTDLGGGLALLPLRARHAERCCGALLYWRGAPVLGWSGDSGYDAELLLALAAAPTLLLDGRAQGGSEHSGFAQLQAAADAGLLRSAHLLVYGYGRACDAPCTVAFPRLCAAVPGMTVPLIPGDATRPSPSAGVVSESVPAPAPACPGATTGVAVADDIIDGTHSGRLN